MTIRTALITATLVSASACLAMAGPADGGKTPETPPEATEKRVAVIGHPAPKFTLRDLDGKTHALANHAGKIVVLEWFNAECPFSGGASKASIHASGKAAALRANLKELDPTIVYLIVDSTARNHTRESLIERGKEARTTWKIDVPVLIDYDGVVGRAYEAQTTPHMYVIDAKGVLRYAGAFDDDKKGRKGGDATNHVLSAVKQIRAGEAPSPDRRKPWGCSVKFDYH